MNLLTKHFNDFVIRIILIDNQEWFIAKDIADVLEYSETSAMTRTRIDNEDVKKVRPAEITGLNTGQNNDITLINESGLYSAILGSKKPEAKQFKRWVTNEVLPSIRKTGNYSISQNFQLPEIGNSTEQIIELKNHVLETSNLIEILESKKPTTLYRLDKFYRKFHNFSVLQYFEIDLDSQFFLPTELGKMINKSAVEINLMLANRGFQIRENGIWKLTDLGREFGIEINGKFVKIKWRIKTVL